MNDKEIIEKYDIKKMSYHCGVRTPDCLTPSSRWIALDDKRYFVCAAHHAEIKKLKEGK